MEELFHTYQVDVYFSGHVHQYERSLPVYKDTVDPNGYENPDATTHLLIGGAGNDDGREASQAMYANSVAHLYVIVFGVVAGNGGQCLVVGVLRRSE